MVIPQVEPLYGHKLTHIARQLRDLIVVQQQVSERHKSADTLTHPLNGVMIQVEHFELRQVTYRIWQFCDVVAVEVQSA